VTIKCTYSVKRHNKVLAHSRAKPEWLAMLDLCWKQATDLGYTHRLYVVFQTGASYMSRRQYGYFQECGAFDGDLMVIYTYHYPYNTVIGTIAHEFGHALHCTTIPCGNLWTDEEAEAYAEEFRRKMVRKYASE